MGELSPCPGLDFDRGPDGITRNRRTVEAWARRYREVLKFNRNGPQPLVEVFAPAYRIDPGW